MTDFRLFCWWNTYISITGQRDRVCGIPNPWKTLHWNTKSYRVSSWWFLWDILTVSRSGSQAAVSQSVSWSVCSRFVSQSVGQSAVDPSSVSWSVCSRSVSQPVSLQLVRQSVSQSAVSSSVIQLANKSVSQPASQPVNRTVSQSVSQSDRPSVI